jgi:hypothetical protein
VCYLTLVATAVAYAFMVDIGSYFGILICISLIPIEWNIFYTKRINCKYSECH